MKRLNHIFIITGFLYLFNAYAPELGIEIFANKTPLFIGFTICWFLYGIGGVLDDIRETLDENRRKQDGQ